ncbi:MAG: hypothetical protein R3F44_07075 [Candidatus Competibacteraceae bacterium]
MTPFQRRRVLVQGSFFILFVFAPIFDLLRFDLTQGHLIVFGQPWTLGLDDYLAGRIDTQQMALNVLLRVIVPVLALAATVSASPGVGVGCTAAGCARTFRWWKPSTNWCARPAASRHLG